MAGLDGYDLRARLAPGYLALAPVIVSIVVLVGDHRGVVAALGVLVTGLGVPFLLASQVRDRGKAIEPDLWSSWGGAPATAMLRATASEPEGVDRRCRAQERAGVALPSALAQRADGVSADREIQRVVNVLIKQTRADAVVQSELGDYGMRRNLLGVREIGLWASAATFVAGVGNLIWTLGWTSDALLPSVSVVFSGAFCVVGWCRVTPEWVRVAAHRYATALLT